MDHRASNLLAAAALIGASLISGSAAATSATAALPELQQKPAPPKPAVAQKAPIPAKNPIPMSENSLKAGRAVYAKICRACHGLQGKGDGPTAPPGSKPANLVDAEWKYGGSDGEIFMTIKNGVKPYDVMEPWGRKISDTDIWNTVNFLRDLGKRAKK